MSDDTRTLTCLCHALDVSNIGAVLKWRAWKRQARQKFRDGKPLKTYSQSELIKKSERVPGLPPTVADDVSIGKEIEVRIEARRARKHERAANEPRSPSRPSSSLSSCSLVTFSKAARIIGPVVGPVVPEKRAKSGAWEDEGREHVMMSPYDTRRPQTAEPTSTHTTAVSAARTWGRKGPMRPASSPSHRVEVAAKHGRLAPLQATAAIESEQGVGCKKAPLEEERDDSDTARKARERVRATSSYCQRLKEGPVWTLFPSLVRGWVGLRVQLGVRTEGPD